ncbi:MAG TPA: ferritin family protein [bacterium]|nr:ferritin family protein [bacterium]
MTDAKTIDILKQAILGERRGAALYDQVAKQTKNPKMAEFFKGMAEEEKGHEALLAAQLKSAMNGKPFTAAQMNDFGKKVTTAFISRETIAGINAAGFEAAAIASAINLEKNAVEFYGKRADAATDDNEKKLYRWLSDWEKGHLDMLNKMDQDLTESVWDSNQFFPY